MNEVPTWQERRAAIAAAHPSVWQSTTFDRYLQSLTAYQDRPLVVTDDVEWSYGEVIERADAVARGLQRLGVVAGDRVAMVMANHPEFPTILFGAWRLGASVIPINFTFRAEELSYVLKQSGTKVVITMDEFRGTDYLAFFDQLDPGWKDGQFDRLENLTAVVVRGQAPEGALSLDDLCLETDHADAPLPILDASPDDQAIVMYTSGTTGRPKGVTMTHDAIYRTAYAAAYHRAFEDGRRILFSMPLYHAFGLVEGLLAATIVGGSVVPQVMFDPKATLAAIGRHQVTSALFVPTMTMAVLEHPDVETSDLTSLFSIMSAAAATPAAVWRQVREKLGVAEIYTGYGMTEHTAGSTMTAPDEPLELVATTVGKVRNGGIAGVPELGGMVCEYATADPYTGAILPAGAEGELVARGPSITKGYFAQPELDAELFLEGGWLRSGDLGRIRPDGYVQLTGRSKELYKTGGELVAPVEVEATLNQHAAVGQSYVVGLPDERWGEIGCAWVVLASGASVEEHDLVEFCQARLAKFKVPRHILFVAAADLPATATGKVQKFMLIKKAEAELGR